MSKELVILESPGKVKAISKYLGSSYNVIASNGHIIDLPSKELGVDMGKFENAMAKHTYQAVVKKQMSEGSKVGTRGTPAFYINGRFLSGAQPIGNFEKVIDQELNKAEAMVKKGTPKTKIYDTIMKNAEKTVK